MTEKKPAKKKSKPEVEEAKAPTETTNEHEIMVLGLDEEALGKVFNGIKKGAKVIFGEDIFHSAIRNIVIRIILGFIAGRGDASFKVRSKSALRVQSYKNAFGLPHNLDTEIT